ncbi:MAG: hypothetical protein K2G69_03890, partial [Muribaculaceae bacterium]|nr:hypothetical protein [Muribaculaceae bacterium]
MNLKGRLDSNAPEGAEVDVYVINDGVRSTVRAVAKTDGSFEAQYTPQTGQNGHFSVGACYPGDNLKEEMAGFDIYGLRILEDKYFTCKATAGIPYNITLKIGNPCSVRQGDIKAMLKGAPEGIALESASISSLDGGLTGTLDLVLTGNRISAGDDWETFSIKVCSKEGGETDIPVYWYCYSARGLLLSSVSAIEGELPQGETIEYPVTLTNTGSGETGRIEILLPEWMKCAGPTSLPSLKSGESVTITLLLKTNEKMNLNYKVTGQLAVNCTNGNGVTIPFSVMPVSDSKGELVVSACDEYTYNTAEAPMVAGAKVKVVNPGSGLTVAEGYTDENGVYSIELNAGYYRVDVSADNHESWSNAVYVNPGKRKNVYANISFNPVTISYKVVPTQVEDEYKIETEAKYEMDLPMQVVRMIFPPSIDGDSMAPGDATIINVQIVNEGLMSAFNVRPVFETNNPEWSFEMLDYKEPFELGAHQTVNIPVRITRTNDVSASQPTPIQPMPMLSSGIGSPVPFTPHMQSEGRNVAADIYSGCLTHMNLLYEIMCGEPITKNIYAGNMSMKFCALATLIGVVLDKYPISKPTPSKTPNGDASLRYEGGEVQFSICNPCDAKKAETALDQLVATLSGKFVGFWNGICMAQKAATGTTKKMVLAERFITDALTYAENLFMDSLGDLAYWIYTFTVMAEPCVNNQGSMPTGDDDDPIDHFISMYSSQPPTRAGMESIGSVPDYGGETSEPYFEHTWQETFYNETNSFVDSWKAIVEAYNVALGDAVWISDPTADKIEYMKYVSSLPPRTHLSDEEVREHKPESVTFEKARAYADRVTGYIDVAKEYGDQLVAAVDRFSANEEKAKAAGFETALDRYTNAYQSYLNEFDRLKNASICASVSLKFSQTMTMTREAFRGTLEVFNGHQSIPMRDVRLNLTVKNQDGTIATSREFQTTPETLSGFDGELNLTSGWELGAGERGKADILFIPTKYAAPALPTVWTFGGNITYLDPFTNLEVTRKLQPVSLTVNPTPELDLTYFLQRDVYSDDPHTEDVVEASEEAEFALIVKNVGAGVANNVRMLTRQPEIVDNEKGVLLETSFVSSQLNGEEKHLALGSSMATDFGSIPSGGSAFAQWWFKTSIVGHFIEYDVKATHVSSYDNPDLSLLGNVAIHELIRGISDPDADNNRRLLLANDIADSDDL